MLAGPHVQGFQIHDHTGAHLADEEMDLMHAERVQQLQRLAFRHIPKLMELSLSTVGTLEKRATLEKYLNMLDPDVSPRTASGYP